MARTIECYWCNGTGRDEGSRCGRCEGRGVIPYIAERVPEWVQRAEAAREAHGYVAVKATGGVRL